MLITPITNKSVYSIPGIENNNEINPHTIKKASAYIYNISVGELDMKCRKREFKEARFIAMYFTNKYINWSLVRIGIFFNFRHHSTVIHAIKQVEDWMESDKIFHQNVCKVKTQIKILNMKNPPKPQSVDQLLNKINDLKITQVSEKLGIIRQKLINVKKSHSEGGLILIQGTIKILREIELSTNNSKTWHLIAN